MARVTVEDCEEVIPNRFNLVVLANQRVKQYKKGAKLTISDTGDKEPVLALREIAYRSLDIDALKDAAIKNLQNYAFTEEDDDYEEEDTYDPVVAIPQTDTVLQDEYLDNNSIVDFSCIIQEEDDFDKDLDTTDGESTKNR